MLGKEYKGSVVSDGMFNESSAYIHTYIHTYVRTYVTKYVELDHMLVFPRKVGQKINR